MGLNTHLSLSEDVLRSSPKPFAYSSSLTMSSMILSILLRLMMRWFSQANIDSTNYCTRLRSIIQSVSHVLPPSVDSACSQCPEVGLISDHRSRVRTGFPSSVSSFA